MRSGSNLDREDPLASFRERFEIDDPDLIYLDGNSLGRLPKRTRVVVSEVVDQWSSILVRGWGEGWIDLPQRIGSKIAELIGAEPDEVVACDSTSVNLYKLVHAALAAKQGRGRILTDHGNFPSDLYLLQGLAEGREIEYVEPDHPDGIIERITKETALLCLSHVSFRSSYLYEMERLTAAAHRAGALTIWDLSHSAGVVPIQLRDWGVDLAVGCTYKFLNGGPGAIAFLYVRRELQEALSSPIQGWFGQKDAFAFDETYRPAGGVRRFMAGTPPILSLAAVEPGIDLCLEAGIQQIRFKSIAQTDYLIQLAQFELADCGFELATPAASDRRGSHVSLRHPEAWRISQALIAEANVIPDFRSPDLLRLGVAPLYNTFAELEEAVARIGNVVRNRTFEKYSTERRTVT
jgi:kynureninase